MCVLEKQYMLIWPHLLKEKLNANYIYLISSRQKFSVFVSLTYYVRNYECNKTKRTKEVVIKVNLPRTLDYTRNVARISKAIDFCQGHVWRLVYHSPSLKNIIWASKVSQHSMMSMCFPLGSEEEILWWLLQMEWNWNVKISFQLDKKSVCRPGHQEGLAISKLQGHTVIQSPMNSCEWLLSHLSPV